MNKLGELEDIPVLEPIDPEPMREAAQGLYRINRQSLIWDIMDCSYMKEDEATEWLDNYERMVIERYKEQNNG